MVGGEHTVAEVQQFAYGWVNPVLAYIMSVLGCLLGIMLATKAQARTGRRRVRLLIYASIAIGGTGVWQAHVISLLGFAMPDSAVRYDPLPIAASLGIAIVVVGGGLFVAGFGSLRVWRLLVAGALLGIGVAATHYTSMAAVRVGGSIDYEPVRFVVSVGIAMTVACAALWFIVALKGLRAAVLAALVMGAAVVGMHYVGMSAVQVHLGDLASDGGQTAIVGVSAMLLVPPVILVGAAVIAMLWFFTVGTSTIHDLRAIFTTPEKSLEIEPWMIEEVTARIAIRVPDAAQPTAGGAVETEEGMPTRRPPGPRPTPGITPVWLSMPVWGSSDRPVEAVPYAKSARARANAGRVYGARREVAALAAAPALAAPAFAAPASGAPASGAPSRYPPAANPDPVSPEAINAALSAAPAEGRRSGWRNHRRS